MEEAGRNVRLTRYDIIVILLRVLLDNLLFFRDEIFDLLLQDLDEILCVVHGLDILEREIYIF